MKKNLGVLLSVFSLPSKYGIGDFGKEAYKFVDYISKYKVDYWQILPLTPTSYGDSPYQSFSSFAINPYFIDLDNLIDEGYLQKDEVEVLPYKETIDYNFLYNTRLNLLKKAYARFKVNDFNKLEEFENDNLYWLFDYCLFMVLKDLNGQKGYLDWDEKYRYYNEETKNFILNNYYDELEFYSFIQYIAHKQYLKLKKYASNKGIKIIGDLPIYVSMDSADVYSHRDLFYLDDRNRPYLVAGVPPDYFSKTGQLWGNPIYNYENIKNDNDYLYWRMRIYFASRLYDVIRLDHFRGFEAYYAIKYPAKDAINGTWYKAPGYEMLSKFKEVNKNVRFIAEDLGFLTKEVLALKAKLHWPGLGIYEFAFDVNDKKFKNVYLAENMTYNEIGYIGTHDNNTLKGFLNNDVDSKTFKHIKENLKVKTKKEAFDKMLENLAKSKTRLAIYTLQDLLEQDEKSRINTPNKLGNWTYRLPLNYLKSKKISSKLIKFRKLRDEK